MCQAENKCSINSTHCRLLLSPLQVTRGRIARWSKSRWQGPESRAQNWELCLQSILNCPRSTVKWGTITTPSLQIGSKFREAGTLPEATQQVSAAELRCSGSGKCSQKVPLGTRWCSDYPRRSHHSTTSTSLTQRQLGSEVNLWHHHPYLWILQGRRSIMEGLDPERQIQKPICHFLVAQPPGGLSLLLIKIGNL